MTQCHDAALAELLRRADENASELDRLLAALRRLAADADVCVDRALLEADGEATTEPARALPPRGVRA